MCWFMILWIVGCKSHVYEKTYLTDYVTLLLYEKVKSSIMSKSHRVIRYLKNYKKPADERGIERNAWWFWIVIIQIPKEKVVITIEDVDLTQPLIKLRIKSIRLMAFNQMPFKCVYNAFNSTTHRWLLILR